MAIITLTTDYGTKDYFTAAIKGAILTELPGTQVVDISHEVEPFDIHQGAFILRNSYKHFPKGTIHMMGVDAERTLSNDHIAAKIDGHYFIGADNGFFALLFPEIKADKIISIGIGQDDDQFTFPMKDVFVRAACHIARGGQLAVIGREKLEWKESKMVQAIVKSDKSNIRGMVIYVDNFGNLVTNISATVFKQVQAGRDCEIILPRSRKIHVISNAYSEVAEEGKALALFNSSKLLEIAISRGHGKQFGGASSLLGMNYRDIVTIYFK
ncbi:MAG: S-adenosylmethionine hydrolase [Flavobacteriales bacterium]|jgi:S-adenosylmethionine hydrolase